MQTLSPVCLSPGVLQLLQSRTSRKFLACRLTPDMETKLLFMTSRVSPPHSLGVLCQHGGGGCSSLMGPPCTSPVPTWGQGAAHPRLLLPRFSREGFCGVKRCKQLKGKGCPGLVQVFLASGI